MLISYLLVFGFWGEPGIYGTAPKNETPVVSLQTLAENPEAFLDKVVKVEGQVKEVCPKAGCWLDLSDQDKHMRIKVKDGEIIFGKELEGKRVIAEGTVYKFELSREQAVRYMQHQAEEKQQSFDPATVTSGMTIYQIGGIGVQVKN